ncbi:Aste57867_3140 [Aphanomyces stellatus]|uniref:Aste57867_3140 protein n=1 Tax=Aphanomyces stellatus TaxID=120398 RepID=A0A485KEU0_9STRA|nr:hypothetical protein As57867_003131 [Aphanomyces stellatus]VFT80315.1 Aste57867_3140 [Aphanomyces stellatus]
MCSVAATPALHVARPIVLTIPDLCGRGLQLLPAEAFLRSPAGGAFTIERFQYDASSKTLHESGAELLEVLHRIKPHSAVGPPCYMLTHGYGALVLREAFRAIDWAHVRTRLVMVAPPNRGCLPSWAAAPLGFRCTPSVALDELHTLADFDLDMRLGKLPRLTRSLIVAGTIALPPKPWVRQPLHSTNPSDGAVAVAATHLPGEYTHMTVAASHNLIMLHPATLRLVRDFMA